MLYTLNYEIESGAILGKVRQSEHVTRALFELIPITYANSDTHPNYSYVLIRLCLKELLLKFCKLLSLEQVSFSSRAFLTEDVNGHW